MDARLYLIRHGRTQSNTSNKFRGDSDVPLTSEGEKDARDAVEFLKGVEPDFIVCSDRKRAVETAEIFSNSFGHSPIHSTQLRAWDVGTFTGLPRNKENLDKLKQYIDNPHLEVPGGESLDDFRSRVLPVIEECFQATSDHVGFVICHSSVIHELGNQMYGNHDSLTVEPGGIVILGLDPEPKAKPIFKKLTAKNAESIS